MSQTNQPVPATPKTSSRSGIRVLAAALVGVVVSVLVGVSLAAIVGPTAARTVGGLIVGSLAAGAILRAQGLRQWIGAVLLVFVGQLLLGIIIIALVNSRA